MINKFLIGVLALLCIACVMPVMAFSGTGSGTSIDPYVVNTTAQWAEMENGHYEVNDIHYALGNDIDFQSDPAKSAVIRYFMGSFDGRGFALKNFYNEINSPTSGVLYGSRTAAIFSTTNAGTYADNYIKNLVLINCTLVINNDTFTSRVNPAVNTYYNAYGLLTGFGDAVLSNIYVDENSWLRINGYINPAYGEVDVGIISGWNTAAKMKNVVSRGNIYVATPLRTTEGGGSVVGDYVGGIRGYYVSSYGTCPEYFENILSAGTITVTFGNNSHAYSIVPDFNPLIPGTCGTGYPLWNGAGTLYYDSTLLGSLDQLANTYGVPTSGMTTQSNFPNMTFGMGAMAMSNLSSMFHGYPIPYYFGSIVPPTPTPTPTTSPVPTYTGTPIPTFTPTPTPTVTPSPISPSKIRWTTPVGVTITSAYYGDTVRYYFDTVVAGENPPYNYTVDKFYLNLYKKNTQLGVWEYISHPGFETQVNGTSVNYTVPAGNAKTFSGNAWRGWGSMITGQYAQYKIALYGVNNSYYLPPYYPVYEYGNATLSLSQNPFLLSNIGWWLNNIGGAGFRYFAALLIIGLLVSVPYLIMRQFIMPVEILMFGLALGISFYIGLLDLWVMFFMAIGAVAIYFLMNRNSGVA